MAYQLKISIIGVKPAIWRRLRIPGNITFQQLHQTIQAAFGWLDYHLYKFEFDKIVVTVPDDAYAPGELYGNEITELNSITTVINELFDSSDRCVYEYDFGDSWQHEIIIEKRLKDTKKNEIPKCLDGERQRPPEDVGGIHGYEDFLNTIMDKKNPERADMLYWAEKDTRGRIFDPEYFNINEVNRRLMYALEDDEEHAKNLLTGEGLSGKVVWGWSDVCIDVKGKLYTIEYISNMLLRIGEGSKVTIQVEPVRNRYY
ncbi:MAG TPA: plasmid pRiA4b ORF-3 family protein [Clostridiaceae bacterium]|nr:plasmid pRiA4b ORF-3 family protein [Clostridiaceae bacterium]